MIKNHFSISAKDEFEKSKLETEIAFSDLKKYYSVFGNLEKVLLFHLIK